MELKFKSISESVVAIETNEETLFLTDVNLETAFSEYSYHDRRSLLADLAVEYLRVRSSDGLPEGESEEGILRGSSDGLEVYWDQGVTTPIYTLNDLEIIPG